MTAASNNRRASRTLPNSSPSINPSSTAAASTTLAPGSPRSARAQQLKNAAAAKDSSGSDAKQDPSHVTAIYQDIIDDLAMEVIYECHREHKLSYLKLQKHNGSTTTPIKQMFVDKPGLDIYGNRPEPNGVDDICECMNCKRRFPSQRFAHHMEKCLGMGGRRRQAATRSRLAHHNFPSPNAGSTNVASSSHGMNNENGTGISISAVSNGSAVKVQRRMSDSDDMDDLLSSDNDDLSSLSDGFEGGQANESEDQEYSHSNAPAIKRKRKKQ